MDHKLILTFLFFGFGLTSYSHIIFREYHYVNLKMNWADAQHYCREKYTDLATIENMEDISKLNRPSLENSKAWIGLTDDPKSWRDSMGNDANSWKWSATGETSRTGYENWSPYFPNNYGAYQLCGAVTIAKMWDDWSCNSEMYFICYQDTNPPGQKNYTLIQRWKNWKDAQAYCRRHFKDLAMIENDQENAQLVSVLSDSRAWIGLHRVSWRWSDNSSSSFKNWAKGQPNNDGGEYCVAEYSNHLWSDRRCNTKNHFWCHVLKVKKTIVRMKIQTDADLSGPDINIQILDQINAMMRNQGLANYTLRWNKQTRKEADDKDEED